MTIIGYLTLLAGFYMAWSIGANDVANAMGTSVGSKALTIKKAVFLAAILEFLGSVFSGNHVSLTIQQGIIHPEIFQANPMIFILGMLGALLATSLLLHLASYLGMPISTTHAIVGAVLGFGWIIGGKEAVQWNQMVIISSSWVLSPIISGCISYFFFLTLQRKIFYATNPVESARKLSPFLVFISLSLLTSNLFSLPTALAIATISSFASIRLFTRIPVVVFSSQTPSRASSYNYVEKIFVYLQIITACLVAFAHGANDVANAIGPVAAIFQTLTTPGFLAKTSVPLWLLILGGSGIVLGLATLGWRVIETVGKGITELTPTRGFCAEFSASATILLSTKLGLPISTTHALVGAVFGIGLAKGLRALNLKTLRDIVFSWLATIPISATLSILVFYLLQAIFL